MTEKLKVSREVADAIEEFIGHGMEVMKWSLEESKSILVAEHSRMSESAWSYYEEGQYEALDNIPTYTLMQALVIGYEVEMTPHEEIAVIYKRHYPKSKVVSGSTEKYFSKGYVKGIKFTLEKLGITIEGVNDND